MDDANRGRVVGELASGEDRPTIEHVLRQAPHVALRGGAALLVHSHIRPRDDDACAAEVHAKREAIAAGVAKRYVLRVHTSRGTRIVKIAETLGGNWAAGWLGTSVARQEHQNQHRAARLGLAAAPSLGFLEWRRGIHLRRACQVQAPIPEKMQSLEVFLAAEIARVGVAAATHLGEALAQTHRVPFFHADLKAFHAFVDEVTPPHHGPATYALRWIDLARVSFWMSPRKRLINLYQVLRFVLPDAPALQQALIAAYCAASGWHANRPNRALRRVQRFLQHKMRVHPYP